MAYARSLCRRPPLNRWNYDTIVRIRETPLSLRDKYMTQIVVQEEQPEVRPRAEAPLPRAFWIQHTDLVDHGFSVACQQCEHN